MAGGTFIDYNKPLVGTYINFVSRVRPTGQLAERGTVAAMLPLDWGNNEILVLTEAQFLTKTKQILGVDYTDDTLLPLRELFTGADEVLLYNSYINGAPAEITFEEMRVVAVKNGVAGNKIGIELVKDADNVGYVNVITYFEDREIEKQTVSKISELESNDYVRFEDNGTTDIVPEANFTYLVGGINGEVTSDSYTMFLESLDNEQFNVLVCNTDDEIIKNMFVSYTKLQRDDKGKKFVTVMHNKLADYEGVINLYNDCTTDDLSVYSGVYWVAGQSAGAEITESLTYKVYDGELTFESQITEDDLEDLITQGRFVFRDRRDTQTGLLNTIVEQDINSFTSFEPTKNKDFSNNKIVRILDQVAVDVSNTFINVFVKNSVANSELGRSQLRGEIINLLNKYDALDAIEAYDAGEVIVAKGPEKGDVVSNISIEPIGAMEKLYLTVEVI